MSSEKVLVIVEMDGTFLGVTAGDFVDVRVINWAAIREDGGLQCPECGHDEAEPDMTTAEDRWICDGCGHSYEAEEAEEEDDGPGPEYVKAFNAHIEALKAPPAFPFATHGEGQPATRLEMMRIHSLIGRWLDRANGETVVCEYQVGNDNLEKYFQSWRSASRYFWKLIPRPCKFTDNVWCYLDVFTVDDKGDHLRNLGNVCLLSMYEGDIGLYCKDQRGIQQPPQP